MLAKRCEGRAAPLKLRNHAAHQPHGKKRNQLRNF